MKWMIASDLHGSAFYTEKLLKAFDLEQAERLVLLGDLLYHGPRNDLPQGYEPKKVIAMLNERKHKILCVRGNCEAEVDQMVLDFPVLADYCILCDGGQTVYATHGHLFSEDQPPKLQNGDILLCGHTHIPACTDKGTYWYLNPGSVSIPKNGSHHGYMIWENGSFLWKDLDGNVIMQKD
ncbi:MAG: phosphodiesterase [Oscillospiraceae bacterium]|nr:phosphodiesterase [Oscillospiraceae bacterium]